MNKTFLFDSVVFAKNENIILKANFISGKILVSR